MDAANPIWESVPGVVVPLSGQTITTPIHPNLSVKTVMVKMATNGQDIGVWANWGDQTINNTPLGLKIFEIKWPSSFRFRIPKRPPFSAWVNRGEP